MVADLLPSLVLVAGIGLLFLSGLDRDRSEKRLAVRLRQDGRREVVSEMRFREKAGAMDDDPCRPGSFEEPCEPDHESEPLLLPLTLLAAPPVLLAVAVLT